MNTTSLPSWTPPTRAAARLAHIVARARRAWRQACDRRRHAAQAREALRELHAMDDRTLADIGLMRADLPWLAQHSHVERLARDAAAQTLALDARARSRARS